MASTPPVAGAAGSTTSVQSRVVTSGSGRRWLAVLRIATGFIFLWAFLDKTFGLHYSTGAPVEGGTPSVAWIDGGTPSQGFMKFAAVGPFADFFGSIASTFTDWLFMAALLGIGIGLMAGVALRITAVAGTILMLCMWAAEWPPLEGSSNPVVDYHVIYALVMIVCAVLYAGDTWGLGRWWGSLVGRQHWLR
ncbi:DoxX family protein [Cellulomonas cellasea]|uniref:DoxX family protein n=1 Tax=Cellulomonas cellasea TaxID=43670 RepID=UPI0025A40281|nr:DoxX family protein [Cellulomonas cellasea]MDM8084446.1 DoxX family protein [Cellulomonas cellasea]